MTSSFNFYLKHCKRFLLLLLTALASVCFCCLLSLFQSVSPQRLLQLFSIFVQKGRAFLHGICSPRTALVVCSLNLNSNLFMVFYLSSAGSWTLFLCFAVVFLSLDSSESFQSFNKIIVLIKNKINKNKIYNIQLFRSRHNYYILIFKHCNPKNIHR